MTDKLYFPYILYKLTSRYFKVCVPRSQIKSCQTFTGMVVPLNLCSANTFSVQVYISCHLHNFPVSTDPNPSLIPMWNHNCSNEEKEAIEKKNVLFLLLTEVTPFPSTYSSNTYIFFFFYSQVSSQSCTTLPSLEECVFKGSLTGMLNNKQKRQKNKRIFSTSWFLQSSDLTGEIILTLSQALIYKCQQQVSAGKYPAKGSTALPKHCSLHTIFLGTTHVLGTLAAAKGCIYCSI